MVVRAAIMQKFTPYGVEIYPPYVPRARVGGSAVARRERHARTRGTHYLIVCLGVKYFTFSQNSAALGLIFF